MENENICHKKGLRKKKPAPLSKECPRCFLVKSICLFYKKSSKCIACSKLIYRERKHEISAKMKEYHIKNRERKKEYDRIKNLTKRSQINLRKRNKYKLDINNKLSLLLRGRVRHAVKGGQRVGSPVKDMGCTVQELKNYIELQFKDGMTWENHGVFGWHIDHKKPLAMFDLSNRESFLQACHYTNLQPMWWIDNTKKGSRYID